MSSLWFNLRILFWHIQIEYGRLFRFTIGYNGFHVRWATLLKPIWLHEFSPIQGWLRRHEPVRVYANNMA